MYDFLTKNESFIEVAAELKSKGIKNYKFFLYLEDEGLQGVDPYDENLSIEMQLRIKNEVMNNYWYFLREVLVLPEAGGFVHFQLSKLNLALSYCSELDLNTFIEAPRQSGKTIGIQSRMEWVVNYGTINSLIAFQNKKVDDGKTNLKRFKDISSCLPHYLRDHLDDKKDTKNQMYYEINSNGNKVKVLSTATTEQGADGLGRGLTMPIWWCDEFAFLKYCDVIYEAAYPALSKACESAAGNGTPYGITLSTTPNNRDSREGAYSYNIRYNAVKFEDEWYDLPIEEVKRKVKEDSNNDFVHIIYHYWELGRDEEWFQKQCRGFNGNLLKVKRELLLEWPLSNENSPFTEEQLDAISKLVPKGPIGKIPVLNGKYKFLIYSKMYNLNKKNWIISIDIGGGGSADSTVFCIIDPLTKKICAILQSNTMRTKEILPITRELLLGFFPRAVIVPERTGIGIPIVDAMMDDPIVGPRLYYETKERIAEKKVEGIKVNKLNRVKTKVNVYGVVTSSSSRPKMFEALMDIVDNEPHCITAPEVFEEMKTLERTNGNRIEHAKGQHDDCVMSYLIGLYVLYYGTNCKKFISLIGDVGDESEEYNQDSQNTRINNIKRSIRRTQRMYDSFNNTLSSKIIKDTQNRIIEKNIINDYVDTSELDSLKEIKNERKKVFIKKLL